MKHLRLSFFAGTVLLILLAACAPRTLPTQAPPAGGPPPSGGAATAIETLVPVAAASPTATLQPVALAGPPMEVGSTFRYIDGSLLDAVPNQGPFIMGHGGPDDPQHQVTVSDFWIYNVEVSNQMYAWCESIGKCTPPDLTDNPKYRDPLFVNYPVVGVNWQQATDYCTFVNARLPTEAEWEKAASWDEAKKVKRVYPWGDNSPVCDLLNFGQCVHKTTPVVDYPKGQSFYGLLNMSGNVFEWVADWYLPTYYGAAPTQDPLGPDTGTKRSVRSTAFNSDAFLTEAARRFSAQPTDHRKDLGFRCVVEDPTYFAPFCTVSVSYGPNAPGAGNGSGNSNKPCPDPSIQHGDSCGPNNTPYDYVTVHNNAPTIVTVTGLDACNPSSNDVGVTHQCGLGITIHVDAKCDVQPAGSPGCPAGYDPDPSNPKQCKSKGGPGACPSGYTYDNTLQCCSAVAGNNATVPLCDVGQHFYNGACVDDGQGPQQPNSVTYTTSSGLTCQPGNPGNPGCPNVTCEKGFTLNSDCQCVRSTAP